MRKYLVNPAYANREFESNSFQEELFAEALKDGDIKRIYKLLTDGVNPNAHLIEKWSDGFCYLEYAIGCPLDVAKSYTVKKLLRYFGATEKMMKPSPKIPLSEYEKKYERREERRRRKQLKELVPELFCT